MNRIFNFLHSKKGIAALILITVLILPKSYMIFAAKKPTDIKAPLAPQNLTAVITDQISVSLKWSSSTDKSGINSYLIYKDSTYLASTTNTSYKVTGLTNNTSYSFYVKAKDNSGNVSLSSNIINVKTAMSSSDTSSNTSSSESSDISSSTSSEVSSSSSSSSASDTSSSGSSDTSSGSSTTAKISAGYYASWSAYSGYTPLNIPASKLTHINYAFANIGSDLKIALGDSVVDITNFAKLNELKKQYPNLKTLISVGGWEWSGKFSDVALTDVSRTIFADSVITFIKQYGFNGVDIDWEYPVAGGLSTNTNRPEDKTNFTLLLKKLREKLDYQGSLDGEKYLLSFAGGAGQFYVNNTELNLLSSYADYAVIMTYDIHGAWDTYTDFNAGLYTPNETSPQYKWSVDSSVKSWVANGFPASKIVMGVPFYGHVYYGVANVNNGLYKTFSNSISAPYDKIITDYLSTSGFTRFYHTDAKVPWLFNGSVFVSYDDEQSIAEKAKYIASNNLAGASAWELSQNKDGTLINVLYNNMN